MRQNPLAAWEVRVGEMRVYYRVQEAERLVQVLAIGVKRRHRVYVGERVVEL
jgi:mRNA-degrading endonuclease RelE of RelBE toxin-antitoxin system